MNIIEQILIGVYVALASHGIIQVYKLLGISGIYIVMFSAIFWGTAALLPLSLILPEDASTTFLSFLHATSVYIVGFLAFQWCKPSKIEE